MADPASLIRGYRDRAVPDLLGVVVRFVWSAVLVLSVVAGLVVSGPVIGAAEPDPVAEVGPASTFTPLSPTRMLDTRTGLGGTSGAVGPNQTITLDLAERLPVAATAVVLNVTAVDPTSRTYVTVFPSDTARPATSNLNVERGEVRANLVTVSVGADAGVRLYNRAGDTHLVADIAGYYATDAGSMFTARQADRVLTTRVAPNSSVVVDLSARVPDSATAVVVNVTGVHGSGNTFLTAWPTGTTRPHASTVNVARGSTTPNLATVKLGSGGRISVYNHVGTIDVVVDLAGFYSPEFGAEFVPVSPSRVFDTRDGTGTWYNEVGPLGPQENADVHAGPAVPDDAVAVAVNLTGIEPTTSTFVSAWNAQWDSVPTTSNLNLVGGRTSANLAMVPTRYDSSDGRFFVFNNAGATHVAADLAGYFVVPPAPCSADCVYVWGTNNAEAGTGRTTFFETSPAPVHGLSDVVAVSRRHAVRADGSVWSWGDNRYGRLGNGWSGGESPVPVRVSGLSGAVAVAETQHTSFALRSDGTVWAWGQNGFSLVGDPGQEDTSVPVRRAGLSGITAIAASDRTAYALRSDGTVWAWGAGDRGQLGHGAQDWDVWDPVQVAGLTGVVSIAAGDTTAAAVRAEGTAWTWGENNDGELGHGSTEELSTVPVRVMGLTGVTDVSLDYQHGFAVLSDGTVWGWGQNVHGGLGNGVDCDWNEQSCRSNPVQVSNLTGAVAVSALGNGGLALDADGRVWVWGSNSSAEFGNGTVGWSTDYALVPRQVPDLASVETLEPAMFAGRTIVPNP